MPKMACRGAAIKGGSAVPFARVADPVRALDVFSSMRAAVRQSDPMIEAGAHMMRGLDRSVDRRHANLADPAVALVDLDIREPLDLRRSQPGSPARRLSSASILRAFVSSDVVGEAPHRAEAISSSHPTIFHAALLARNAPAFREVDRIVLRASISGFLLPRPRRLAFR